MNLPGQFTYTLAIRTLQIPVSHGEYLTVIVSCNWATYTPYGLICLSRTTNQYEIENKD